LTYLNYSGVACSVAATLWVAAKNLRVALHKPPVRADLLGHGGLKFRGILV